ncbi:MAG: universal stress protein [Bacteroidia bacterium]|nr:universal stress protein [Bacteroidia bacterium]
MKTLKILIPVDLSEANEAAFSFLKTLPEAKTKQLSVTLLHFLQFPVVPGNFLTPADYLGDLYQEHMDNLRQELENVAAREDLKDFQINQELIASPGLGLGEAIGEYARDNHFNLVILASRHRKGLGGIFAGSELMPILRYCPVPMLVLSPGKVAPLRRIVFATDFSKQSGQIFGEIRTLAEFLEAEVQCFRVNTVSEFQDDREFTVARNQFMQSMGFGDFPEISQINAWEIDEGILFFAEDHLADAVALATHGYKGFSRLFNSSVTERIIAETTYPVLVFNLHEN